jgi:hypothetical protein
MRKTDRMESIIMKSELSIEAKRILEIIDFKGVEGREESFLAQEFRDKLLGKVDQEVVISAIESFDKIEIKLIYLEILAMVPYTPIQQYCEELAKSIEIFVCEDFQPLYNFFRILGVLLHFDNPYGIVQFAELEKKMISITQPD